MKLRDILVILGALIFSIAITLIALPLLKPAPSPQKVTERVIEEPKKLILVAQRDINAGEKFSVDNFKWQEWPLDAMNPNYVTKEKYASIESIQDGIIKDPLNSGEPVILSDIVRIGDRSALAGMISPGMRAFTIPFSGEPFLSNWVAAGDWIDVIVAEGNAKDGKGKVVAEHVRVLAIDDKLEQVDKQESEKAPKTITIEVTPRQVEELTLALKAGVVPAFSLYSINSSKDRQNKSLPDAETRSSDRSITIFRGNKIDKVEF